jgi:hypothetical protein
MNDQQNKEESSGVRDKQVRAALDQHWAASDANDFETARLIYHEDAVLEYPHTVSIMEFRGDKVWRENTVLCGSIRGSRITRSMGRTDGRIISRRRDKRWTGNSWSSLRCRVAVIWNSMPSCRVRLRILGDRRVSFEPGLRGFNDRYDCGHADQRGFHLAQRTFAA